MRCCNCRKERFHAGVSYVDGTPWVWFLILQFPWWKSVSSDDVLPFSGSTCCDSDKHRYWTPASRPGLYWNMPFKPLKSPWQFILGAPPSGQPLLYLVAHAFTALEIDWVLAKSVQLFYSRDAVNGADYSHGISIHRSVCLSVTCKIVTLAKRQELWTNGLNRFVAPCILYYEVKFRDKTLARSHRLRKVLKSGGSTNRRIHGNCGLGVEPQCSPGAPEA